MFAKSFALLCLLPIATATPHSEASTNSQALDISSYCDQWNTVTAGQYYSLVLDEWGKYGASSGYDCASLTSLSGTTVAWKSIWNWTGGNSEVKSFTNIQLNSGLNQQLDVINNIPTLWKWSYSSPENVVADVAYDLFTSYSRGGGNANEIMIWLGTINARPISTAYNSDGMPNPVARNINLAGHSWNLHYGYNGANNVYSFLPSNGAWITSFHGDLNVFLKYLTAMGHISTAEFLKTVQAGTEATSGSATFTTSAYSVVIN